MKVGGTVTSYDGADGLGIISLHDGREIRFGLTACQDLIICVDLPVLVTGIEERRGKLHALRVDRQGSEGKPGRSKSKLLQRFDYSDAPTRSRRADFRLLLKWCVGHDFVTAVAVGDIDATEYLQDAYKICDTDFEKNAGRPFFIWYTKARLRFALGSLFERDMAAIEKRFGKRPRIGSLEKDAFSYFDMAYEKWAGQKS